MMFFSWIPKPVLFVLLRLYVVGVLLATPILWWCEFAYSGLDEANRAFIETWKEGWHIFWSKRCVY